MNATIGPFSAAGTTAQLAIVAQAVAAIDPAILAGERAGRIPLTFGVPPDWTPGKTALGFTSGSGIIINQRLGGGQAVPIILHEYAHKWFARFGTRALRRALMADMVPAVPSTVTWGTGPYRSRPAEVAADTAVEAWTRGAVSSRLEAAEFWQRDYPDALIGKFLSLSLSLRGTPDQDEPSPLPMPDSGGDAAAPIPFQGSVWVPRRRLAFLRAWPGLAAPAIRRVVAGGRISTGRGVIGSAVREPDGSHSSSWLEVLAVNGRSIAPRLWVSVVALKPASPPSQPPAPANG